MHSSTTLTALLGLATLALATPNGWSKNPTAEDGPSKLDECMCQPIYEAILKCQTIPFDKTGDKKIRECVCIPNSRDDAWYGYIHKCSNCLSPGSYELNDFFDNFSRLVNQLFVSCTNVGGGITSSGDSICASNAYHKACASLAVGGKESWASYESYGDKAKGNGTYVLELANAANVSGASSSTSSTSSEASSATTETTVASPEETEEATATSTDEEPATTTDEASEASTTAADAVASDAASPSPSDSPAVGLANALSATGMVGFAVVGFVGAVLL
ncbi:hypothetical protein VTJ04DRAFT_7637 [Mycothermus thermophilus]|uniref:uncharacterized protein n=1 Tax=Humicola insolens TaxID=85995 RepID=UPI003742584A